MLEGGGGGEGVEQNPSLRIERGACERERREDEQRYKIETGRRRF